MTQIECRFPSNPTKRVKPHKIYVRRLKKVSQLKQKSETKIKKPSEIFQLAIQNMRSKADSNRCTSFADPLPDRSATRP